MVSGPCQLAHRNHLRHLHKRLPAQALAEPPAAPPAPSARPRLLLTWGNVTPTGADAPNQAEAGIATPPPEGLSPCTGVLADPVRSDYTIVGPPQLPLQDATYSCIYVPLLLDAAGILALPARRQWREHPVFAPWWGVTVDALLSRPFMPVHQVLAGINNVARAHSPSSQAALARVREWAALRGPGQVTSLAVFVREVGQQAHGYYLCGPLQEVLLVLLLGANAAATLAHRLDALRAPFSPENDQPAHALPGVDHRDAGDPPEQPPHAGPTAPDTGEVPHEQVPSAEDHGAAAEAQPVPHTAEAGMPQSAPSTVAKPDSGEEAGPDPFLQATCRVAARARGRGRRGGRGRGRCGPAATPAQEASEGPLEARAIRRAAAAEAGIQTGLLALDAVSLEDHFRRRALTLQGVPARLRGTLRAAMRAGPRLAVEGASPEDAARGWKLFFLAPRMLLFRSPGELLGSPLRSLTAGAVCSNRGCGLSFLQTPHGLRPPTRAMDPQCRTIRPGLPARLRSSTLASSLPRGASLRATCARQRSHAR